MSRDVFVVSACALWELRKKKPDGTPEGFVYRLSDNGIVSHNTRKIKPLSVLTEWDVLSRGIILRHIVNKHRPSIDKTKVWMLI